MDPIAAAIQQVLADAGDGWTLNHYVVAVGIERIGVDGEVESAPWWITQPGQPEYVSDGILRRVEDMRARAEDYE